MKDILRAVEELIVNFAVLTAFLFVTSQVIYRKRSLVQTELPWIEKLKYGIGCGLLGIILMLFTVGIDNTILDFRQLAIIISALGGGLYSAIITGIFITIMRLFAFGTITTNTIIAAANCIIIAVCVGFISRTALRYWRKWIYSLFVSIVLTSIVFIINLGKSGVIPTIIFFFMMSIGGLFTAYLVQFLIAAKKYSLRMEKEATIDFLTGLNNHRSFDTNFNESVNTAIEKKEHLALMLMDIDYFKKMNDTYGHPNGDSLLKQVGELLSNSARNFDIVSRIGGEEFSIILKDCPHHYALVIAERIRVAVQDHPFILNDGNKVHLTVSIGVASLNHDDSDQLMEEADASLYKAKQGGRNRVCSKQT